MTVANESWSEVDHFGRIQQQARFAWRLLKAEATPAG